MNTTHLFVELLVIGIGAFFCVLLLVATLFGLPPSAIWALTELKVLFPLLAVVYVLGILTDRIADRIFDRADVAHREEVFGKERSEYFVARRTLVMDGENLWRDLEYVRSRLRICRGWAVNSILLLLSLDLYFVAGAESPRIPITLLLLLDLLLLVLAFGCWWCWQRLNRKEYGKTKRLAEWLKHRQAIDTSKVDRSLVEVFAKIADEVERVTNERLSSQKDDLRQELKEGIQHD